MTDAPGTRLAEDGAMLQAWRESLWATAGGVLLALIIVVPAARGLALALALLLFFLFLYALVLAKPAWALPLVLACYVFWFVPPAYAGSGTTAVSANLAVLPALVALIVWGARRLGPLRPVHLLMLVLATWFLVVLVLQAGGAGYALGVAGKTYLWLLVWIPAAVLVTESGGEQRLAGAMVIGALVVSGLTVQETLTGWNYFEWANPGLVDTRPVVRFGVLRYAGPFGHGVPTSVMLSMMLPFCFLWRHRLASGVAVLLSLVALYVCQARATWLGMVVGLTLAVAITVRRRVLRRRTVAVVVVIAALLVAVFFRELSFVVDVLRGSFSEDPNTFGGFNLDATGQLALGASLERTNWWLPLLAQLWHVPMLGYGPELVATQFRLLAGVLVNEWPAAVQGWYSFGPLYGALLELFLLGGTGLLAWRCLTDHRRSMGFRVVSLVAMVSAVVALHVNYVGVNWALPLMCVLVASGDRAGSGQGTDGGLDG